MRSFVIGIGLIFGIATVAQAQDWVGTPQGLNEGISYRQAETTGTPLIRVLRVSGIETACSCDLTAEAGPAIESQIEFGLSTLWIDAYDLSVTKQNSTAHVMGDAETETGSRKILAGFYDGGDEAELRVYLDAPDDFKLSAAKIGLRAVGTSGSTLSTDPKPASTSKPVSGADLLAGIKRDLDPARSTASNQPSKPQSRSGRTSGADLLAGIRKDVYGPGQARAAERAKAQAAAKKAAREKALREVIKSGGYDSPVIFKDDTGRKYIANWVEGTPGIYSAKAGDKRAPQLRYINPKSSKIDVTQRGTFEAELKKAGLTVLKLEGPERLEITETLLNQQSYVVTGTAKRAGEAVRLFANISYDPAKGSTNVMLFDAPISQWKDWGGIATPMAWLGVYEQSDFTPAARAELSVMGPSQEIPLFEEHFTGRTTALFQGIMSTQAATLNSMRSFNMSSAACAGVENCSVSPDGVGGYEAVIE